MSAPLFQDPNAALAELVEAKRALDIAQQHLREREAANVRMSKHFQGSRDDWLASCERLVAPLVVEVQRAKDQFDTALAIYQEAARARDAAAQQELAEALRTPPGPRRAARMPSRSSRSG